jgi:hypothetical protein
MLLGPGRQGEMSMLKFSGVFILIAALLLVALSAAPFAGDSARIEFDLPLTVECRDASPADFAQAHPTLKVIEARFRISARIVAGSESQIADVLYIIASPDRKMRFQDYLPNTALESAVADDQIEVTDTTEDAKGGEIGAKVGYQGIGGGISRSRTSKKTQSNHYREIAPRALVVASGTTDGVFFKLKPSRAASLEGAKAYTLLAIVPKTWRGGWCTISCGAAAKSKSFFGRGGRLPAGMAQAQIGLHLAGDAEANRLAEELADVQERHADVLAGPLAKAGLWESIYDAASTGHTAPLCGSFKITPGRWGSDSAQRQFEIARGAVLASQERLQKLSE